MSHWLFVSCVGFVLYASFVMAIGWEFLRWVEGI